MADVEVSVDASTYSNRIGFLFVFNLIVGTGALALPKAFQNAGYVLAVGLTTVSCFISYVCATFVIESMSIANAALLRLQRRRGESLDDFDSYSIKKRVEVSEMAKLFLGRTGHLATYAILIVYLFGDLSIFSATVPKSIMNILCSSINASSVSGSDPCRFGWPLFFTRLIVYRFAVVAFATFVALLVFIGMTRTKYLQLATTLCRWTAFSVMILLASVSLYRDGAEAVPPAVNIGGFGPLFGTTIYAFMCHHSLPALITPMRNKGGLMLGLCTVYCSVLMFYLAMAVTGSFAFEHLFDVYSLNFLHDDIGSSIFAIFLNYFLALFPVFTLTTNYPIVATTLSNNINVFFDMLSENATNSPGEDDPLLPVESNSEEDLSIAYSLTPGNCHTWRRRAVIAGVILLPTMVALATDNVLFLASLTGSYPGVGVQFIIPSLLVLYARRYNKRELGELIPSSASSPFSSMYWPYAMFAWSLFTVFMVTLNILKH